MNNYKLTNSRPSLEIRECRRRLLQTIEGISSYCYNFYHEYNDNDLDCSNPDFITSVSVDSYNNVLLFIRNNFEVFYSFENKTVSGVYFKITNNSNGIIITPNKGLLKRSSSVLNRDIYTLAYSELLKLNKEVNSGFLENSKIFPNDLFMGALINAVMHHLKIGYQGFARILYNNSLEKYLFFYKNCLSGKTNAENLFSKEDRTHTEICSFYYYWIFRVVSDQCCSFVDGFSFHDVGTQFGFLPVMIMILGKEKLIGFNATRIIASDCVAPPKEFIDWVEDFRKSKKIPVMEFCYLNLTESPEAWPMSDVVVLVDVLEHLPDDSTAFQSLQKLWGRTRFLLIVHVPIETEKTMWRDHNILFNGDKLRRWARKFPDGIALGDNYLDGKYNLLTDLGFLILKKDRTYD
ncbi:MAG: hypothetical protein JXK07_14860 [Spirochaetes bacterium]|nr:hypothetical protein [Spirochaetota bacterium]MBN2769936.1 hypothetical protein [Spirochaetota bacterium]